MKPFGWLVAVLLSVSTMGSLALADDQAVDDLDMIYLGFQSSKPLSAPGPAPQMDGYFVVAKFWLLGSDGTPNPAEPTALYASAYLLNATSTLPLFRASFNGTRLFERSELFGPVYLAKRSPEPFENWISWYAHLSERTFPRVIDLDNISDGPFDLTFPAAYRLLIPDRLVVGSNDLTLAAASLDERLAAPSDARVVMWPSRGGFKQYIYYGGNVAPNRPSLTFPKDNMLPGSPGWELGPHAGLAGFSACNEKVMEFEGGKKYVFRACTIMVKPVDIMVERPATP